MICFLSLTLSLLWISSKYPYLNVQVYSSTEHLATPSNLSFSSDRSHSEDKEERGDAGGLSPSPAPADGSFEHRHAGRMARWGKYSLITRKSSKCVH